MGILRLAEKAVARVRNLRPTQEQLRVARDIRSHVTDVNGNVGHALDVVTAIMPLVRMAIDRIIALEEKLAEVVRIDPKTGILSLAGFRQDAEIFLHALRRAVHRRELAKDKVADRELNAEQEWADAQKEIERTQVHVLFIDFDNFKRLNTELTQLGADEVMRHAAQVIQEVVRRGEPLGRFSGKADELLIATVDGDPKKLAQRVHDALRGKSFTVSVNGHGEKTVQLTVSIGIASCQLNRPQEEWLNDLIARADQAKTEAKAQGKNTTVTREEMN